MLLPVAGILDVLDNYAFVRTSGYLAGPDDVYVSLSMARRYGLRKGDAVTGQVKQIREHDRKEKFNPLVRLESVNGTRVEEQKQRVEFAKLTPLYPQERLRLETEATGLTTRIIDIIAPIGKGQRGLIVSPSKAGKTMVLQAIANAITTNNPESHLMVVLVDERPEEVTDMQRAVKGEVISSTFDRPASDHTSVAELAIERAEASGRAGPRRGGAARLHHPSRPRVQPGGSGQRPDHVRWCRLLRPLPAEAVLRRRPQHRGRWLAHHPRHRADRDRLQDGRRHLRGVQGHREHGACRLRRDFADKRIFPSIDVDSSGTRREELLMTREELQIVWKLRRVLSALDGQQALELMIDKLKKTRSNVEFLMQVQNTTPQASRRGDRSDEGGL